jgi:hypothetical protein
MRELSGLAKFFIICAAVFFVGLIFTIAGIATGGVNDIEKLAEHYDWIQAGPGERGVTAQEVEDFNAIEFTGEADLYIVGKDFYKKASWLADQDVLEQTELDVLGKNKVIVVAGDEAEQPEITVENGVLKINTATIDHDGISFSTTDAPFIPQILICAPMEELEHLTVSGDGGDLELLGVAWKNAKISLDEGDINMEGVKSTGLSMETDSGDIEIQGEFMKTTSAVSDSGDIEINTSLPRTEYAFELSSDSGDTTVKEGGEEAAEYEDAWDDIKENGGPHKIIAKTDTGDIEVDFGN